MNGDDSSSLAWPRQILRATELKQFWFSVGEPPRDAFEYTLNQRSSVAMMLASWFAAGVVQQNNWFGLAVSVCSIAAAVLVSLRFTRRGRQPHGVAILAVCLAVVCWWVSFPRQYSPGPATWVVLSPKGCVPSSQFGLLLGVLLLGMCFALRYARVLPTEGSRLFRQHLWLTISFGVSIVAVLGSLAVYAVKYQHSYVDSFTRLLPKYVPFWSSDAAGNTAVRLLPNRIAQMEWPDGDALLITFAARDPAMTWHPNRPTLLFSGRYTASFSAAWSTRRNGVWSEPTSELRIANPLSPTGIEDRFDIELRGDRVITLSATHGGTSLLGKPRSLSQSGTGTLNPELGLRLRSLVVQKLGTLEGPIRNDPNTNPLLIPGSPSPDATPPLTPQLPSNGVELAPAGT